MASIALVPSTTSAAGPGASCSDRVQRSNRAAEEVEGGVAAT